MSSPAPRVARMVELSLILLLALGWPGVCDVARAGANVLDASRANSVRVLVPSLDSKGTGFLLDAQHVVTAFHVIGRVNIDKSTTPAEASIVTATDVSVILATGEQIGAQVIAPVATQSPVKIIEPLPDAAKALFASVFGDFAVLKLQAKPQSPVAPNPLLRGKALPPVGAEVVFSGYPLGAPTMLSHRGTISGFAGDQAIICIQAPVNKGNSGGALLNDQGDVIGIITNREGGISEGLRNLALYIEGTRSHGRVGVMGVDPLAGLHPGSTVAASQSWSRLWIRISAPASDTRAL